MAYSLAQMQSLLRQAGWPESLIVTAAAIGMAESSGNACIVGTIANNEYSVGLWQININPSLKRPWTRQQLCDPLFNAKVALQIYQQSGGFRPWGAYTDGRYRKYIPASQTAYQPGASPSVAAAVNTMPAVTADYVDSPLDEPSSMSTKLLIGGAIALSIFLLSR